MTATINIPDSASVDQAAREFIQFLKPGRTFAFNGAMGAGKTTFIAALARVLGVTDDVSSPTFSIVNEYVTPAGETIYHFDCYRIESDEEALDFGVLDYFESGNISLIEWPDRISRFLPDDTVTVEIRVNDDNSRTLLISNL